jgi:TolA-binding protein
MTIYGMEILQSALILVAAISAGVSGMFIARSRSITNKHSRQRIKDYENDIKHVRDDSKQEAKDYRQEILRLKGTINKMKQGVTVTEHDMKNQGLGEVIMQLVPNKYRKAASFLIPQVEEAVKKDPALIEKVYEKIKSANTTSNKQTQAGPETQGIQTL